MKHHIAHRGEGEHQIALAARICTIDDARARQSRNTLDGGVDAVRALMRAVVAGHKADGLLIAQRAKIANAKFD